MKSTFSLIIALSLCSGCTAMVALPWYLAQMAAGLAQQTGFIPPGLVPPIPPVVPANQSLAPIGGIPAGAPTGELPGVPLNPPGKLPELPKLPTSNLPGGANGLPTGGLPTGNFPANLPTGNLPGTSSIVKKLKPKPTPEKLAGHQKCLETYFPLCFSGQWIYCYLLHICAKMY